MTGRPGLWLAGGIALVMAAGCKPEVAGGRADGAEVFSQVCARCHGPAGQPPEGMVARLGVKPLTSAHVQAEMSDADIRKQILEGSANKQMPAFAGALTDAQVEAVIDYVRGLDEK